MWCFVHTGQVKCIQNLLRCQCFHILSDSCCHCRYEKFWLPLLKSVSPKTRRQLAPPLDIYWIWHCHMLRSVLIPTPGLMVKTEAEFWGHVRVSNAVETENCLEWELAGAQETRLDTFEHQRCKWEWNQTQILSTLRSWEDSTCWRRPNSCHAGPGVVKSGTKGSSHIYISNSIESRHKNHPFPVFSPLKYAEDMKRILGDPCDQHQPMDDTSSYSEKKAKAERKWKSLFPWVQSQSLELDLRINRVSRCCWDINQLTFSPHLGEYHVPLTSIVGKEK